MNQQEIHKAFEKLNKSTSISTRYWLKLLPVLGFNDENPIELPAEMLDTPGLGLRIWQYPNQFAPYLAHIASFASRIRTYLEIGCRHGGTYVTHTELLKKLNPQFSLSTASDLLPISPELGAYIEAIQPTGQYMQIDSHSVEFIDHINNQFYDLVFIDGDHTYDGVKQDADITFNKSNIQVFHDISSLACPDVGRFWNEYKSKHEDTHNFLEFIDQYDSVDGTFLGIGVASRKSWIG